jgi:beta-lactamase class D
MPTVKEVDAKLSGHEKECAIRYANIEKQLDSGNKKFDKIDAKFWILYPLILTAPVLERLFH